MFLFERYELTNKHTDINSVLSGFLWRFAERVGAQGVKLLVEIILARILLPDDYGLIALVTVFITILNVFVDSGLANALIQKKNADQLDFSSVFWFNIVWCLVLYTILFASSPFISDFYQRPELNHVLRVLGLQIIISGIKNVEQAYVSKTMQFRKFFFATLGGTIGAAAIGILMAIHGYGVWALVAQQLFNTLVDTIILWIIVKWRPTFAFSFIRFKTLFSYGWKLFISALIDTGYKELRQMIIGKKYTSSDLAFYNRGDQFPHLIVTNINSSIDSVLLPTMSNVQDNTEYVRAMTRRAIKTSSFLMMPLMMCLAVCAEPIVRIVLTEKWLPCVFFMRIFCFTYAFYPIHTANLNAIKAMGRSDIFLKLEIIKKCIGLTAMFSTMMISVKAMAAVLPITSILTQMVNARPNKKLLNYNYLDQVKDMLPQILLSCAAGAAAYGVVFFGLNDWLTLLLQIMIGALIYIGGSKIFHVDSYDYVVDIARSFLTRRKSDI